MKTGKREVLENKSQGRDAISKLNITQEADQEKYTLNDITLLNDCVMRIFLILLCIQLHISTEHLKVF